MNSILVALREKLGDLPAAEQQIARFIINNPSDVNEMTARDIANKTYTSASSVVRLCRSLNYSGFKEFKQALVVELATYGKPFEASEIHINREDSINDIVQKVTYQKIDSLLTSIQVLDQEELKKSIDLLVNSKRVLLFGLGASALVAEDLSLKLLRVNVPFCFSIDTHSQLLYARNSRKDDVAILFSYSGHTEEMIKFVHALKENQTPCIAITRYSTTSPLTKVVDHILFISCDEALFRSGALSSRIAQLNVVDMLFIGFIQKYDSLMRQLIHTHIEKDGVKEELEKSSKNPYKIF